MFYVNSQIIRSLVYFLQKQGLEKEQLHALLAERRCYLNETSYRFPVSDYESLMHYADTQLKQEHIGLLFGQSLKAQNWGLLGHVALVSQNLEKALRHAQRLNSLVRNIGRIELRKVQQQCQLSWHARSPIRHYMVDELFSSWLSFANHCCQQNAELALEKVTLTRPIPSTASVHIYQHTFNCPIEFGAKSNSLIFNEKLLNSRLHSPNPELEQLLLSQAGDLTPYADHINELNAFIACQFPVIPSVEQAALQLGLKKRSLQRYLTGQQLSFTKLIDQQRKQHAKRMLLQGYSVLEISNKLGFSEQSALQRAFKRWYDTTPKKFLNEHMF